MNSISDQSEPYWTSKKDAWGRPLGRYSFKGRIYGWTCHHCGGSFRSERAVVEHQSKIVGQDALVED
jgi:hypothetical protein